MTDAPGVRDAWASERKFIVADVVSAVRDEMAALRGEILRVMQAECTESNRILAAAVDTLAASCAKVDAPAVPTRQPSDAARPSGISEDSPMDHEGSARTRSLLRHSLAASTLARSTGPGVHPRRSSVSRGRRSTRRSINDMERLLMASEASSEWPLQRPGELQPSHFALQLATPLRNTSSSLSSPERHAGGTNLRGASKMGKASSEVVESLEDRKGTVDLASGVSWTIAWNPESASRTIYEVFSIALLVFDAVTLPYTLAWSVPEEGFWMVAVWCIRFFWSIDLVLSFFTGYQTSDHKMELHVASTARHFLRTWLLFDAALVISDWCDSGMPGLRLMRVGRLGRFIRLFRQSQRMYLLLQKVKAMLYIKGAHLAIDISILLLMLMWLAHVLCCAWYVIGKHEEGSDTGATWLSSGDYSNLGSSYEYLTALHWSLTQITPASMEVVPKCSAERLFNVFVIFGGFVVGSFMVATLTAMMTQYRIQVAETLRKMRQLLDFLAQEKSGKLLTRAIKVQILSALRQKQRLRADQVELLPLVSSSLKNALNLQVGRTQLAPHPFLGAWAHIDSACLISFVHDSMTELRISIDDALFFDEEPGTSMFFVLAGSLLYKPGCSARESTFHHTDRRLRCERGEFCTEVALWFDWHHLGNMTALAPTELAAIDVSDCDMGVLRRHTAAMNVLKSYALAFQNAMKDQLFFPSDLTHDIDYNELMFALPLDSRMVLSRPLFDQIGAHDTRIKAPILSKAQLAKLEAEVAEGKNIVGIAGDEMVRVIFVAAIRIYQIDPHFGISLLESGGEIPRDSRFIVRLGELDLGSNVVKANVILPGGKRRSQETPVATVTRIIETEIKALTPSVDTGPKRGRSREQFIKESPTYGVRTCYSRTCFVDFTNDDLEHSKIPGAGRDFKPELPTETPRYMEWFPRATRITAEDVDMHARATHILQQAEIFWAGVDEKIAYLYAWLNQEEFDILSDERAKLVWRQYADHLSKKEIARIFCSDL